MNLSKLLEALNSNERHEMLGLLRQWEDALHSETVQRILCQHDWDKLWPQGAALVEIHRWLLNTYPSLESDARILLIKAIRSAVRGPG